MSAVADTNVNLDIDNDGDFGVFLLPRVELGYQGSWFDLGADAAVDIRQYADSSAANDVFYRVSGFTQFGLALGCSVALWALIAVAGAYLKDRLYLFVFLSLWVATLVVLSAGGFIKGEH